MSNQLKNIVLFDGDCIFCNRTMQLIFKHDRQKIFYYGSLQSFFSKTEKLIKHSNDFNTIIYLKGNAMFQKSAAILKIMEDLGGVFLILASFFRPLPNQLLDYFYDLIARNRYRMSKYSSCGIPSNEMKSRIINMLNSETLRR